MAKVAHWPLDFYGPEYTAPEHLYRLRVHGVSAKPLQARRRFALG